MDKYDELLAGLDLMVADGWKWPKLGAAAIRDLEAELEAERNSSSLRIAELVQACKTLNSERNYFFCTNLTRAEAAEQRLREEVAHLSQYSDTQFLVKVEAMERATEAEVKLHEVEAALKLIAETPTTLDGKYIMECGQVFQNIAKAALAPERTGAEQEETK